MNHAYFVLFPVVSCGGTPKVWNASHNIVPGFYGDTALYTCKYAYWFSQGVYQIETTCSISGDWIPTLPEACKRMYMYH